MQKETIGGRPMPDAPPAPIPAPPPAPAPVLPPHPEDHAIVIGINRYPFLGTLQASEQDAARFAEWLISPDGGGLPPSNVHAINSASIPQGLTDEEARPIQKDIDIVVRRVLRDLLEGLSQRIGRRLYFYFAGHGLGPNVDDVALLMADAARTVPNSNLGVDPYRRYFVNSAPFDEIVFFLDCCRDFNRLAAARGPDFGEPPAGYRASNVRYFVAYATQYGQKAYEDTQQGLPEHQGYFSKALLEGLNGAAVDGRSLITAASLKAYLMKRVPELAGSDRTQVPTILDPFPDMLFGRRHQPLLADVSIYPPNGAAGELELYSDNGFGMVRQPIGGDPWRVQLARGLYKLTALASGRVTYFEVGVGVETRDVRFD
jgi:hypothetical protein